MDRNSGQNDRNESQIEFVADDTANHNSAADFYAAVIHVLWEGWDSAANTERYIENSVCMPRTSAELRHNIDECLRITPVPNFKPDTADPSDIHSFRDDWNVKELVWMSGSRFWFMGWDTSA